MPASEVIVLPRTEEHLESLERGLRVLALFGADRGHAFAMIEVAEALDIPRAAARRVLFTLESLGYVANRGGLYALTPRVLTLGYAYLSSLGFRAVAQPVLERLVERTGHTCSIGVLDGGDVVYVLRAEARRLVRIDIRVGTRIPAWASSMGRMLLASLPDAELDARLETAQPVRLTRRTVTDKRRLRRIVLDARRRGWCAIADEVEEGIGGIAMPLRDRAGRTIAATNISLALLRAGVAQARKRLRAELERATSEIEQILQSEVPLTETRSGDVLRPEARRWP
jgi:IclR family pca regulon transcriptional regulator